MTDANSSSMQRRITRIDDMHQPHRARIRHHTECGYSKPVFLYVTGPVGLARYELNSGQLSAHLRRKSLVTKKDATQMEVPHTILSWDFPDVAAFGVFHACAQ